MATINPKTGTNISKIETCKPDCGSKNLRSSDLNVELVPKILETSSNSDWGEEHITHCQIIEE
jgi:hypothetical protein